MYCTTYVFYTRLLYPNISFTKHKHKDFLTDDLRKEVDACSPMEGDRDMESGCISGAGLQRLESICKILFKKNREFTSVYQLCQFAALLGSKWYFHIVRQGYSVCCHYAPQPTSKWTQVSPGRQCEVKKSLKSLVQCQWEIKCSPLEQGVKKDSSEITVKITNGCFMHSCNPGIQSHVEAIKKSGAVFDFSAKRAALGQIVDMLDSGAVPPSTLRALIRKHIPPNIGAGVGSGLRAGIGAGVGSCIGGRVGSCI